MTERGLKRKLVGTVVSNKGDKSAVVEVERLTRHKNYRKILRRRDKYMAHDPQNRCQIGDRVRIIESRPISRLKRWQVLEVIQKGEAEE